MYAHQGKYMKANRLSELSHGGFLTPQDVLHRVQKLAQCSSMLTYCIRSPEWGEKEVEGLHDRVKDYVSLSTECIPWCVIGLGYESEIVDKTVADTARREEVRKQSLN